MDTAAPRAEGRVIAIAIGVLLAGGCSRSAAQLCEDGTYCPEGTRCGSGDFCLVEEAACAEFSPNAPCSGSVADGGAGFCVADACQAAVTISGRVASAGGGAVPGLELTALDRVWMDSATTDALGGFEIAAVQNDTDLVLRVEERGNGPPVLTRRLAPGTGRYQLNGDATVPLRVPTRVQLQAALDARKIKSNSGHGAVVAQIGTRPGNGANGATAALDGPSPSVPLYFKGNGDPDPLRSSTLSSQSTVMFLGLEPGIYTLTASPPGPGVCRGAGDDGPDPVLLDVRAGEVTSAGWIVCRE